MIREFTKSALSFSWALSLVGLKQSVNVVSPGSQQKGVDLLTPMTQAAVEQLDESTRGFYRSGENLQARAVDMAFACMNPGNWLNPNTWMRPFSKGCGQQDSNQSQDHGPSQPGDNGQNNVVSNLFTKAVTDFGQAMGQAASGLTKAAGQATAGVAQAVAGNPRQTQSPASGAAPGSPPVNNDSAAAGWGPMPGDR